MLTVRPIATMLPGLLQPMPAEIFLLHGWFLQTPLLSTSCFLQRLTDSLRHCMLSAPSWMPALQPLILTRPQTRVILQFLSAGLTVFLTRITQITLKVMVFRNGLSSPESRLLPVIHTHSLSDTRR